MNLSFCVPVVKALEIIPKFIYCPNLKVAAHSVSDKSLRRIPSCFAATAYQRLPDMMNPEM